MRFLELSNHRNVRYTIDIAQIRC